jgi:hypothetical protein
MPRWLIALLLGLLATLWWVAHRNSAPMAATGTADAAAEACRLLQAPAALEDVLQTPQGAPAFRSGNALITPLAGFSIAARVLAREDYHLGREADYSPTDLALGWGPMAAPGLAERLSVSQAGRWYTYRWDGDGPPIAPYDIATHSANMHLVPASPEAARAIEAVREGEMVRMDGWLVRIDADDRWHWQSSTSRDDTGSGACELVLVCSIRPK